MSAPAVSSSAAMSGRPRAQASISTVTPPGRRWPRSAPASSRAVTTSVWRMLTAADSGVAPLWAACCGLAPRASNRSTAARWPPPAARSRPVQPWASTASTGSPSSTRRRTASASPAIAAAGTSDSRSARSGNGQPRQSSQSARSRRPLDKATPSGVCPSAARASGEAPCITSCFSEASRASAVARCSAALVWPMPEMSSFSPSIASSAVSWIAPRSIRLPRCTNSPLGSEWR